MNPHEAFVRTPLSVLHDNNLSDAAFRLYLEIFGLSGASKKGYCWATNRTLAEKFGKSTRSVIRALTELEEKGYIRKEETRNENTKQVVERRIYPMKKSSSPTKKKSHPIKENVTPSAQICHTPYEETVTLPVSDASHPSTQICHSPYDENGTENNNNTIEHTIEQTIKQTIEQSIDTNENYFSSDEIFQKDFELLWNEYPLKINRKDAYEVYKARVSEGEDKKELLTAVRRYATDCKIFDTEEKYIMHASTFLGENRRYEDYLDRNRERWFSNKPKCRIVAEDDDLPF